ncbi:MAG: transcription termination/antitermination protein NusG [Vagococcus sp.]
MNDDDIKWYVVHTYSGYENKVKANIEKVVENRNLQNLIHDIQVPMEEQVELKEDGKQKVTLKKLFPGYVMIRMIMTDDSWYVVRNTRGVTGFVGPASKPVPLTEEEVESMGIMEKIIELNFEVGDNVIIVSGPLKDCVASIQEIDKEKNRLSALVNMFGRETPTELDFNQIKVID